MRCFLPPVPGLLTLAAMLVLPACGDDGSSDTHGFVKVELRRAEGQADSPFPGTAGVILTLNYGECLRSFYEANPNYRIEGVDGEPVFGTLDQGGEGWTDRLCSDPESGQVICTVERFSQSLEQSSFLSIEYTIDSELIEGTFLKFGPLPEDSLANCAGGGQPIVNVANDPAAGTDSNGNQLWETRTFSPSEAATGQGRAIEINAAATGS